MNTKRFHQITAATPLSIAVLGDFCLDRYLEIDPARQETSLETGLPVHNVIRVRAQPGGAGTVLNNLVALGVGRIIPLGFAGDDGEGFELVRACGRCPACSMDRFLQTPLATHLHLLQAAGDRAGQAAAGTQPPGQQELDAHAGRGRRAALAAAGEECRSGSTPWSIMDQVDLAGTGVVTAACWTPWARSPRQRPQLRILADSRRGLRGYPAVGWKMNRAELGKLLGEPAPGGPGADEAARPRSWPGGTAARSSSRWRKTACWPPRPTGRRCLCQVAAAPRRDRHRGGRRLGHRQPGRRLGRRRLARRGARVGQRRRLGRDPPARHHRHRLGRANCGDNEKCNAAHGQLRFPVPEGCVSRSGSGLSIPLEERVRKMEGG